MDPGRIIREHEIFHLRESLFLSGLTEQDHHHDPLGLLDIDLFVVERQQTIDDELALNRLKDADLLELQEVTARRRVETLLLRRIEDAKRRVLRLAARRTGGIEPIEPVEGAVDLAIA